jgi:hypothetical protein
MLQTYLLVFGFALPGPAIAADPVLARIRRHLKPSDRRGGGSRVGTLLCNLRSGESQRSLPLYFDAFGHGADGECDIHLILLSGIQGEAGDLLGFESRSFCMKGVGSRFELVDRVVARGICRRSADGLGQRIRDRHGCARNGRSAYVSNFAGEGSFGPLRDAANAVSTLIEDTALPGISAAS